MIKLITTICFALSFTLSSCATSPDLGDVTYPDILTSAMCIEKSTQCTQSARAFFESFDDSARQHFVDFMQCLNDLLEMGCDKQAQKFRDIVDSAMEGNNE